jgi:hypothetical protein
MSALWKKDRCIFAQDGREGNALEVKFLLKMAYRTVALVQLSGFTYFTSESIGYSLLAQLTFSQSFQ